MLADKMNVHESHEQYCRIKKLANHLMHQSHEESQIAVQLFHNRREKNLFCETKIFTEMQCEKLRMQEFQDSMDTEKAMCRLHELSRRDKQQQEEALYVKYQDEQVHICCQKHYSMCFHIVLQITDFAAKIGEYFELMQRQLPEELLREWKYLFFHDQPLDDSFLEDKGDRKKERQTLLDAQDFQEYQTMSGAWKFENEEPNSNLCPHDRVLGHIRYCIFDMASLKNMSSRPQLPPFSLKACFIGNLFSGKTLCLQKLHKEHGLIALQPESLLSKAMISSKATCDEQLEFSLANREHQVRFIIYFYSLHIHLHTYISAVMRHLTMGIRSEKCVVKRCRHCANIIECTDTNRDGIAHCSSATNLYSMLLY
uniref:CPC1/SPEF2 domain-containing protein n=1 Tax=Eptatretus burgeri TaxID=7764 RepID=A0A8C4QM52_EPTBU